MTGLGDDPYSTPDLGSFEIAGRILHVRKRGNDILWLDEATDSGHIVTVATVTWIDGSTPTLHLHPLPSPWVASHSPLADRIMREALRIYQAALGVDGDVAGTGSA